MDDYLSYRGYDHTLVHFKIPVDGSATNGAYSIIEQELPVGFKGPGKHKHKTMEQTIRVMRGTVVAKVGEQTLYLNTGEYLHVPIDTYHDFYPLEGSACIQSVQSPAGLENMFLEWSQINKELPTEEYALKIKQISDQYDNGL